MAPDARPSRPMPENLATPRPSGVDYSRQNPLLPDWRSALKGATLRVTPIVLAGAQVFSGMGAARAQSPTGTPDATPTGTPIFTPDASAVPSPTDVITGRVECPPGYIYEPGSEASPSPTPAPTVLVAMAEGQVLAQQAAATDNANPTPEASATPDPETGLVIDPNCKPDPNVTPTPTPTEKTRTPMPTKTPLKDLAALTDGDHPKVNFNNISKRILRTFEEQEPALQAVNPDIAYDLKQLRKTMNGCLEERKAAQIGDCDSITFELIYAYGLSRNDTFYELANTWIDAVNNLPGIPSDYDKIQAKSIRDIVSDFPQLFK